MRRRRALLLGALAAVLAGSARAAETGCGFVAEVDGKPQVLGPFADLKVLDGPETLPIVVAKGGKLLALTCDRDSIVPVLRDFRVPQALGVPLYLSRDEPAATVEVALSGGAPRVRLVDGAWTDAEQAQIKQVMEAARASGR